MASITASFAKVRTPFSKGRAPLLCFILAAFCLTGGCGESASSRNKRWDNIDYGNRDNDSEYTLPNNYGCLDDSPSQFGMCQ